VYNVGGNGTLGRAYTVKQTVDDLDRRILDCLSDDARMSASEIARRLSYVTPRTVRRRIDTLVRKGIIEFVALPRASALGYDVLADISVETQPGKVREVAILLAELQSVTYVAMVAGDCDVSIQASATDVQDLQRFIHDEVHAIPGVQRTKVFLLTEVLKATWDWKIPGELP
jgi:DNA-binding Lrp family transcriptional regulator